MSTQFRPRSRSRRRQRNRRLYADRAFTTVDAQAVLKEVYSDSIRHKLNEGSPLLAKVNRRVGVPSFPSAWNAPSGPISVAEFPLRFEDGSFGNVRVQPGEWNDDSLRVYVPAQTSRLGFFEVPRSDFTRILERIR